MAAYLSRLHHISLHVSNADKIAHALVSKFQFNLFAERLTDRAKQLAFRKGSAVFVVNERPGAGEASGRSCHSTSTVPGIHVGADSCPSRGPGEYLYDVQPSYPVDSVCNVCFEVDDIESSCTSLRRRGCDVIVPPTRLRDECGLVTYSVVRSVVGNVCHTLVDRTRYEGEFLPGFHRVQPIPNPDPNPDREPEADSCPITHFDHVTYACPRGSARAVMRWYKENFGFQRFFIDSNEDENEGYVLDQEGIGLRLTAMEYWKCSETGIRLPFKNQKEPDCKFVIAESLPKQGQNQVDTFLEQHRGPGIQHIGLFTENIVSTAHTMARAGVQFFSPPPAYYTEVGKQREIEETGYDPKMLMKHGILLDTDVCKTTESTSTSFSRDRYLLQVFTKPVFSEDSFFLELIERRGATGFGEGNIRALWRSVQSYMESEDQHKPDSRIKTKQTGQQ